MVSVTFLKVCCHSDLSFSCRRCSYSGLVDFVTFSLPFYNFLQVIGVVIELGWVRNLLKFIYLWLQQRKIINRLLNKVHFLNGK